MDKTPTAGSSSWWIKVIRSGARYEDGSLPPEVWREGGVCPTLNAFDQGDTRTVVAVLPAVRRLTPRECERLQAFPDDWTASQSDSARYRMMGNAVTVNVANYIATLVNDSMQHAAGGQHERSE